MKTILALALLAVSLAAQAATGYLVRSEATGTSWVCTYQVGSVEFSVVSPSVCPISRRF